MIIAFNVQASYNGSKMIYMSKDRRIYDLDHLIQDARKLTKPRYNLTH